MRCLFPLVSAVAALVIACSGKTATGVATNDGASGSPGGAQASGAPGAAGRDATDAAGGGGSSAAGAAGGGGADAACEVGRPPYTNPVYPTDFPDPFVYREGDKYYAFATNGGGSNVRLATSTDLATWSPGNDALPNLPVWSKGSKNTVWAPSLLKVGATYLLYYVTHHTASGFQCISVATSATPEGPYQDTSAAPLVCQTSLCGSIDPSPFTDADGTTYLLWKSDENAPQCARAPRLWSQKLSPDARTLLGSAKLLLTRDQTWEGPVIEGPSMIKNGATYFLFYSGNWYDGPDYAIGYASCASPLGPCTKVTVDRTDGAPAPWMHSKGDAVGPGGQDFFEDTCGQSWVVYHAWAAAKVGYASGGARSMRIDKVTFTGAGPVTSGPTTTLQMQ